MRAAVIRDDGRFETLDQPDPTPAPNELVLRVTGCGICGSDLANRQFMAPGTVMGHEFCGEVVAVGSAATDRWSVGERATGLPVFSCGTCEFCHAGAVVHCAGARLTGLGGEGGGFAEYVKVAADIAFRLPDDVAVEHGALVEPFAVGLHALHAAKLAAGERVLVIGAGPVGLTATAWARNLGAGSITVSDPSSARRDAAVAMGADTVVDPTSEELGAPFDVVIECVGRPGMLDTAAGAATNFGRVVVAGVCTQPDPFIPFVGVVKELTMRFVVYYRPDEFAVTIDAFASGAIDPAPVLSGSVGLDGIDDAFDRLTTPATNDLKLVVTPT